MSVPLDQKVGFAPLRVALPTLRALPSLRTRFAGRGALLPVIAMILAGVLLGVGPAAAPAQSGDEAEALDLRPKWKQGQTSRYRITQTEISRDEVPRLDQSRETQTEIIVEATWRVLEAAEPAGGTAELTLDRIEMTMTGPGGESRTITESGGGEGTEATQQWIRAMTGKPLEFEIGPAGSIEGVSGYEAIQGAAGELASQLDEAYFREIAMDLAVMYCGGLGDAEAGDEWTQSYTGGHRMGKIAHDTEYTLRGVQRIAGVPVAMVSTRSELGFEPELPEGAAGSVDIRMTDGSQSGQIMFDLSRHEVVGGNGEQSLSFEIVRSIGDREITFRRSETTSTQILRISEE